jgi:hypothetical protein
MQRKIAVLAACAALWAGPALAEVTNANDIWFSWDAARIVALATELGDTAEQDTDTDGGPPYVGVTTASGLKYIIEPTACDHSNCAGFQLTAEFDTATTADQMNRFNLFRSFTKSYVDGSNTFITRYEINDYGIPKGNVAADMTNFEAVAATFADYLSTGKLDDGK